MKIIFIHGRAQEGKDPERLRQLWIKTLKEGLKKSDLELPISEDMIFLPFYGDKLDEMVNSANQPMKNIIEKGNQSNDRNAQFFHDLLLEVSKNAEITDEDIKKESSDEVIEKGPLNWGWVQAILRAIDKKGKWSELSIKKFTYDVFMYLTNSNIKEEINAIVRNSFDNEPCVVVGHSLGSIVAYNILRDNPSLNVVKFITVGSPLGLNAVKKYLKVPIKMPDCVTEGWFNAFDDRDVVALNPLDKTYFNIQPEIVNKSNVDNQTSNRHGIEGYLNDNEVAKVIHGFI